MKKQILANSILAALIAAPGASFAANDISYNMFEANYLIHDIDLYEDNDALDDFVEDVDDGDGFELNGSFVIFSNTFLFGSYAQSESDFSFVEDTGLPIVEGQAIKTMKVGVGYFREINYKTDFVGRLGYIDTDLDEFSLGQDDDDVLDGDGTVDQAIRDLNDDTSDGFFVTAGVRAQSFDWLELAGGLSYTDLDSGSDIGAYGKLLFEFNPSVGLNLSADFSDNATSYYAGIRFSF